MKFNESNLIELPKYNEPYIYFLVNKDEVVYVGQSKKSLYRPYTHDDKEHTNIFIKFYPEELVEIYEDYYIDKYKPKYNKTLENSNKYKIKKARDLMRMKLNDDYLTIRDLRKTLSQMNITTHKVNQSEFIKISDIIELLEIKKDRYYE